MRTRSQNSSSTSRIILKVLVWKICGSSWTPLVFEIFFFVYIFWDIPSHSCIRKTYKQPGTFRGHIHPYGVFLVKHNFNIHTSSLAFSIHRLSDWNTVNMKLLSVPNSTIHLQQTTLILKLVQNHRTDMWHLQWNEWFWCYRTHRKSLFITA
jgi:hypothetical protein